MRYLKIQNDGLLDIRLLSLMGGTTKANDEYKIGQWGSGLKYSTAWMLRNNLDFRIFIGKEEVKLSIQTEEIRGEQFDIICVNGEKTSVTTNMGGNAWKPWMIVREIWCNALDEKGAMRQVTDELEGEKGKTTFYLQYSGDFQEVVKNWEEYFIHTLNPIHQDGDYKVYDNPGKNLKLYKQGVLIHTSAQESPFVYDIKNADINELREYNGSIARPIVYSLINATKEVAKKFFASIKDNHFEAQMDWDWGYIFSTSWIEALEGKKLIHNDVMQLLFSGFKAEDLENCIMVPKKVYNKFVKMFDGIGVSKITVNGEFVSKNDPILMGKVKQAIDTLSRCDYNISNDIVIETGVFEKKGIMAQADVKGKKIMLSEQLNEKSFHYLVSTIIEENEHIKTGMSDHTREFQQHFIDLYTRTLLEKHNILA